MSYKAIWNNRNHYHTCSALGSVCGTTIKHGTPKGMVIYQTFRTIKDYKRGKFRIFGTHLVHYTRYLLTPEYGRLMTEAEAHQLDRETGRSEPAFRNSTGFVMSRAARKRGYTTTDRLYLQRQARYQSQELQAV